MNRPILYYRTLLWPVVSLLVTGVVHFTMEAIWPELHAVFVPSVLAPALLAYGAWIGYRMVGAGGAYLDALVAGVIVGVLPIILEVVGFGIVLGRGAQPGLLAGLFGFTMIVFGAVLGGGFVLSRSAHAPGR